jgi:hypothetical protein
MRWGDSLMRPVIYLDVDGCVNADRPRAMRAEWPDTLDLSDALTSLHVSPEMLTMLCEIGDVRWLTTWGDMANRFIAEPVLGTSFPVVAEPSPHRPEEEWKLQRLSAYVAHEWRPFIWIDDVATYTEDAADWSSKVNASGIPNVRLTPDPFYGISRYQISRMQRWAQAHTGAAA